jgi:hypothetical protein
MEMSGGAAATMAVSKAQLGALAYAGMKLLRKKKAGGLEASTEVLGAAPASD